GSSNNANSNESEQDLNQSNVLKLPNEAEPLIRQELVNPQLSWDEAQDEAQDVMGDSEMSKDMDDKEEEEWEEDLDKAVHPPASELKGWAEL
ncbi:hypothetical protein C0993_007749, partial [Termitomyces sp. T159_Od127]